MIVIILLIGIFLRLISLNQSLWLDEAINVMAVKDYSFLGMITQYAVADFHPPGWFMILWSWGKIFGYSEISVRMPSVILGVLTIYITYLLGRKLVSKNLGLLAAFLLAINPLHVFYSQEARMYALAALAVSVNMLLFWKLVKGDQGNRRNMGEKVGLVLSSVLVLLSDYVAYFIFPSQFLFLLFFKRDVLKRWIGLMLMAAVLMSWWWPVFLKQLNVGAVASANLPTWKFVVGGFDFKTIPLTFVKFIIGRISLADKVMYALVMMPVGGLFAYLLYQGQKKLAGPDRKFLGSWLIIPIVLATLVSVIIPVYSYFRVIYVLPAFVLFVATGLLSFKGKFKQGLIISIILIEFFCTLVYLLNPAYQREDWKGLVNSLQRSEQGIALFESSGILPPFDYYAGNTLEAKGALKDFPAKYEASVLDLDQLLEDKREVYLVDYLVEISDPQRLVAKRLLDLGYRQKDIKNFNGVGFVYYYEKEI